MDGRTNGEMVNGYADGIDRRRMDDQWLEGGGTGHGEMMNGE